jgi:A/G-specific adenine glycosylase
MTWEPIHSAVLEWYAERARDLPWRRTRDPYAILVAEVMLQQTQVDRVVPKYQSFLAQYPDFASLAGAATADVIRAWQGLGYNRRAVRLQRIARAVVEEYGGALPDTVAGLLRLEGIGRYTAAAVACFAFGRSEPMLDTNVRRVLGRIALGPDGAATATPAALWALAEEALPVRDAYRWNQALMDFGAGLCLERNPRCPVCPARPWCSSAGRVAPALRERAAPYHTKREPPYVESTRYYRGRIVDFLRGLGPDESLAPAHLGAAIKPGFSADDGQWLTDLLAGLVADGLVAIRADGTLTLP